MPGWLKGAAAVAGSAALGVSLAACDGGDTYDDPVDPNPWTAAAYGGPPDNPNYNQLLDPNDLQASEADSLRTVHHHDRTEEGEPGSTFRRAPDSPAAPCDCGAQDPR